MKDTFLTREFELPSPIVKDINHKSGTLTQIMHHQGALGDYGLLKQWQKDLSYRSNWVGNTIPFNYVVDYYQRAQNGDHRHNQHVIIDKARNPIGFLRFLHLAQDTPTRRKDCTKVEESLVSNVAFLKNTAIFQYMYDHILNETEKFDHARVITELGVGLSKQNYGGLASTIKSLKNKKKLNDSQKERLDIAKRKLSTDWVSVTAQFVEKIGFEITDIILPSKENKTSTPQIRISKVIDGVKALPLPNYQQANRTCLPYQTTDGLNKVSECLENYKQTALHRYAP